jgi:hypothetical protein
MLSVTLPLDRFVSKQSLAVNNTLYGKSGRANHYLDDPAIMRLDRNAAMGYKLHK